MIMCLDLRKSLKLVNLNPNFFMKFRFYESLSFIYFLILSNKSIFGLFINFKLALG